MLRFYVLLIALFFALIPIAGGFLFYKKGVLTFGALGVLLAFFSGSVALMAPNMIGVCLGTGIGLLLPTGFYNEAVLVGLCKGIFGRLIASILLGVVTYAAYSEGMGIWASLAIAFGALLILAIFSGLLISLSRLLRHSK